jgi:hypothetical protein
MIAIVDICCRMFIVAQTELNYKQEGPALWIVRRNMRVLFAATLWEE